MQSRLIEKYKPKSKTTNDGLVTNIDYLQFEKIKIFDKFLKDKRLESELEDVAVVYSEARRKYYAYLVLVDPDRNRYEYYKLQLLESSDYKDRKYWVIGYISSPTVKALKREFKSLDKAKNYFFRVFKEKTLNSFDSEKFVQYPGKYHKLNIDYLEEKSFNTNKKYNSVLPKSIENLMKLIFDIDFTKKTIEELNVDTERIRLEQFSLKQIIDAMMEIEKIWHQINRADAHERFIDLTNNYYTLIPYKQKSSIICTHDQVTAEVRNLKGLYAIVQSFNLIRVEINKKMSVIDRYYRLNTEIIPISRTDNEFKLLEDYAKVTNHQSNDEYELAIEEIFKLSRKGEDERFEPFRKFSNRYLLWHGSFLTNFVSIFCHGLKIAPPEVPRLGKKFGKGIYFADMISKSTKFCVTGKENRTGLMLLCEVALGDVDECRETVFNSKAISLYELPKNKHSVKRIGKIYPHPDGHYAIDDEVIVPNGRPVIADNNELILNYNEYVVYNEAQVKMRYLLKLNFIRKSYGI